MVGEIISEWRATSNRNGGRDHSGIVGDIERNQHHPQQPVTCAQISVRQASLCPATSRGMLLLKTQAVPPRRNPLRKDRPKLPGRRHSRSYHLMDAISVHTT